LEFQREMGRFKVNENGELVDMRELSFDQLQSLLFYNEGKLKRARSRDMQIAYEECIKQIRNFMVDNLIQDKMDVFSLAHYVGLRDVRSMIKTYLGSLKTQEETAKDVIKQRFDQRKKIYSDCYLPNDSLKGNLQSFNNGAIGQPSTF
jgi:polyphosphate kinase